MAGGHGVGPFDLAPEVLGRIDLQVDEPLGYCGRYLGHLDIPDGLGRPSAKRSLCQNGSDLRGHEVPFDPPDGHGPLGSRSMGGKCCYPGLFNRRSLVERPTTEQDHPPSRKKTQAGRPQACRGQDEVPALQARHNGVHKGKKACEEKERLERKEPGHLPECILHERHSLGAFPQNQLTVYYSHRIHHSMRRGIQTGPSAIASARGVEGPGAHAAAPRADGTFLS